MIILGVVPIPLFSYNTTFAGAFEPVLFNKIPSAIINSKDDNFEFAPDYSLDFGGETQIEHDDDAELASNMKMDEDDDNFSLKVRCNSNDICDEVSSNTYRIMEEFLS